MSMKNPPYIAYAIKACAATAMPRYTNRARTLGWAGAGSGPATSGHVRYEF